MGRNISSKSDLSVDNLTFIDLKSFSNKDSKYYLDPKQDYTEYSAKEIWNIYKTHPVFENLPFLDQYMLGIFESDNFLEKVINKVIILSMILGILIPVLLLALFLSAKV